MKCQMNPDVDSPCPSGSYRGPAGYLCDAHWEYVQEQAAERVRKKIAARRNRNGGS